MIDIHLLEQFHAFYECGTLSAAAEKLHTSQPALTRIGFWMHFHKNPNTNYLLQMDLNSFHELSQNSSYPSFSSSYYISRGQTLKGKVTVSLADPECHTDYYLACLASDKEKYKSLFDYINEATIL